MIFEKCKKIIFFILKLGVAGAIVWYLLLRDPDMLVSSLRHFDIRYLAAAALFYCGHIGVCSWRWRELALMLNVQLGRLESFTLTMQGIFFSLVIPGGAIGGDVVKMAVISKRSADGSKVEGAFSVLMDRIIGMIALFVLVLLIVPVQIPLLMNCSISQIHLNDDIKKLAIAAVILLSLSGLAASCVIFFHRLVHKVALFDKILKFFDRISHGMVSRMEQSTDVYSRNPLRLAVLTAASVVGVHLMTVVPMLFLLSGLGINYNIFAVVTAVTLGNVAGLIPIFPSGLGGRDLVTVTILVASGVSEADAKTAQLLYTAVIILFNISGGLFFIFDPGRKNKLPSGE